jgi:perosamine synthetase
MDQLAIFGGAKVTDDDKARFVWPVITPEAELTVMRQLHESISIYDKSGVFAQFEDGFAAYHNRKHGLLFNSGTSAVFAMFEAINLQPGDEVLCPVYTFHASVSPMMYTGAVPIFCDSDEEGNISLEEIKQRVTEKTKAVVVTHMWGVPVWDIAKIADFCQEKGIYLLEDCSHAHGASIHGKKVGSFGDLAAWSIQGPKIITGGEGGILVTDNKDMYDRALVMGHYNKRPKTEIGSNSKLKKFYLTGFGLKLRAHPLAIALAYQQFQHLDEFIAKKQANAQKLSEALSNYQFLTIPSRSEGVQNSWYSYSILYDTSKAFNVPKERYVEALVAEGLVEVDIPGSTCLLNDLPLFIEPNEVMQRLYQAPLPRQTDFPNASKFYERLLKVPIWVFAEDDHVMDAYIKGFCKVSDYLLENKAL